MATSKPLSPPPLIKTNKLVVWLLFLGGIAGFLDAAYLTIEHYRSVVPPCTILHGCATVLTSAYATLGPIPVALLGSLYYLSIVVLSLLYLDAKKESLARLLKIFTWSGLIASLYFVYLQLFVLHTICLYCMGSAISSTFLFVCARFIKQAPPEAPDASAHNPAALG